MECQERLRGKHSLSPKMELEALTGFKCFRPNYDQNKIRRHLVDTWNMYSQPLRPSGMIS